MLQAKAQSSRLFSTSKKYLLGTEVRKPGTVLAGKGKKDGRNPLVDRIPAVLKFKNGAEFKGWSIGSTDSANGELVFNTGMVGYPDAYTDPSYRGQMLMMTYPIVGNYGVPQGVIDKWGLNAYWESDKIQTKGVVMQDYCHDHSHWQANQSLHEWLQEFNVPGITGVDTRQLTKVIRMGGEQVAQLIVDGKPCKDGFSVPELKHPVSEVSRKQPQLYNVGGKYKILCFDTGMKDSMLRNLLERDCEVLVVPHNFKDYNLSDFDGVFLANGPGDPIDNPDTVEAIRQIFTKDTPVFGICMGSQMMGLASGGKTYKLPFGHRGHNSPVTYEPTGRAYITSQNHSYAIERETLPKGWAPLFTNTNDNSLEGIYHTSKPFFSVQFHPEARCGPEDTLFLFDRFLDNCAKFKSKREFRKALTGVAAEVTKTVADPVTDSVGRTLASDDFTARQAYEARIEFRPRPKTIDIPKKVLVLGSGGLQIGQAGEFDYSGSQCLKALKEEGVKTILLNPNIATVQTAEGMADKTYFLPVTPEFVEAIISLERPDAVLLIFGGQTALNVGIELDRRGIFIKHGVRVLGTSVNSINTTEDRALFNEALSQINEKYAKSVACKTVEEALAAGISVGYPVIARCGFALGGLGSGFADNEEEMKVLATKALALTPQILVEKSIKGWKELEYEVVRDIYDNCVTVCNMENFDPLGVHTGDSVVIAPSQTLNDAEYHMLRTTAIRVVRHLGIVGECNIQYALDPVSRDYCIIEVNPRLSRSSALASKATGYPLAYVAAKLTLGYPLPELRNSITKRTTANFEPALDYLVCKVPRWDLAKFTGTSKAIGSAMKSVGEVMAVGRAFEEVLQKGLRMVDGTFEGWTLAPNNKKEMSMVELEKGIRNPHCRRVHDIIRAMHQGVSVHQIWEWSKIDKWWLNKCQNIVTLEKKLVAGGLQSKSLITDIAQAKKWGFSDVGLAQALKCTQEEVRQLRLKNGITPFVKQIDTVAGENPAQTNYLYTTYNANEHDMQFNQKDQVMILGGGCYRIGSSVEFDYSAVMATRFLRSRGNSVTVINCNPETVSTDYDESSRLYFEELSEERVRDIIDLEKPDVGVVVAVGGQVTNNLAMPLHNAGIKLLGTSALDIDAAEDRNKFSKLMDAAGVDQPEWSELTSTAAAKDFIRKVGYPVLVRASYVLSGGAFRVVREEASLEKFLADAVEVSGDKPVVVTKFVEGAMEVEIDAVANKGEVVAYAISEHIEPAGVHSGDAHMVLPAPRLSAADQSRILDAGKKMAKALNISGPFNSQMLWKNGELKVIECNSRASRSLPFSSKVLGVPFIDLAARIWVGEDVKPIKQDMKLVKNYGVKVPQFSFTRLMGADPVLGVEMASTGEVACFATTPEEALLKGYMGSRVELARKKVFFHVTQEADFNLQLKPMVQLNAMGYQLFCSTETAAFMKKNGIAHTELKWGGEVEQAMIKRKVDLVVNVPSTRFADQNTERTRDYALRRSAVDHSIPLISNGHVAAAIINALATVPKLHVDPYKAPKQA